MIKICFITTVSITLKSFLVDTAKYLHKTGNFEITFICNPDEEFQSSLPNYINFIPVKMGRGINGDLFRAVYEFTKIFKEKKFDIVQYSTPNASCYAALAAMTAKIPVRLYCQWGIAYVGFKGIKRQIFKAMEKLICCCSTWIEPDSQSNLDFARKEGLYTAKKSSVIWNGSASGVNLNKFNIQYKKIYREQVRQQYSIPENSFVYGFVGRITGDKGINELLSAMKSILENNPKCYLLLVGGCEKVNSVEMHLLNWAESHSQIIFCGYLDDVERYIAAMDCFILPSYREGFGLSVIEAEAMGVPVIVTDIPGPIDAMIDGKTGLVVKKGDIKSLEEAMVFLQKQPDLCGMMGNAGYNFVLSKFEQNKLFDFIVEDRLHLIKKYK